MKAENSSGVLVTAKLPAGLIHPWHQIDRPRTTWILVSRFATATLPL
jgi:hypothetical protein